MSEFVFDDIYGNEEARVRYEHHREFSYFNTVLKLHNKYYENNKMHDYIFSPRKITHKLSPLPHKEEKKFQYYSVEKVNNLTFRINRRNMSRDRNQKSITISQLGQQSKTEHPIINRYTSSNRQHSRQLNRDIIRDVQFLRTTLQDSKKEKPSSRYGRELGTGRGNRLQVQNVNKQLHNFVELAQNHLP